MDAVGSLDYSNVDVTIMPKRSAWVPIVAEWAGGALAVGAGVAYLAGGAVREWVDEQFDQGRSGRLGLVMRVPAPAWAIIAIVIGLVLIALTFRDLGRARGAAVVLRARLSASGVTLSAGPWADAEGSFTVAPGQAVGFDEATLDDDDDARIVVSTDAGHWAVTSESPMREWDAADLADALARQGSTVEGLDTRG